MEWIRGNLDKKLQRDANKTSAPLYQYRYKAVCTHNK